MAQEKKPPMSEPATTKRPSDHPHPALKLRYTLQGYTRLIYKMALSPDGLTLASPSLDSTIRLWNCTTGEAGLRLKGHAGAVQCTAWSPDGKLIASAGGSDYTVNLWDARSGDLYLTLHGQGNPVLSIAWCPGGNLLATGSFDGIVRLWDVEKESARVLKRHTDSIYGVAWSPDGRWLCSASGDRTVQLWDAASADPVRTLRGHLDMVLCLAWSPDQSHIASGSTDRTIRIWDSETGQQKYVLEGHTDWVLSASFLDSGRLLASLGANGAVRVWRTDTWTEVMHIDHIGGRSILSNLAVHPISPLMVTPGQERGEVKIWDLDCGLLRSCQPAVPTVFYVNAKAVLLGDSGVGKSGLGIRIAEGKFRHTAGSTHGAEFWHFPAQRLPGLPSNVEGELTLWDLAGQPEYRLTHQLFLDDTDAALLLFDCSDANDPFRGVPYWAKVLKKHAPAHVAKFLISARCDVSPVTVDRREINQVLAQHGLDDYFKTSASTGEGSSCFSTTCARPFRGTVCRGAARPFCSR